LLTLSIGEEIASPIRGGPSLVPGPLEVMLNRLESRCPGVPTMLSGLGILLALAPPVGGNLGMLDTLVALPSLEWPGPPAPPLALLDSLDVDRSLDLSAWGLSIEKTPLPALDLP
jgi:hypothetical protein